MVHQDASPFPAILARDRLLPIVDYQIARDLAREGAVSIQRSLQPRLFSQKRKIAGCLACKKPQWARHAEAYVGELVLEPVDTEAIIDQQRCVMEVLTINERRDINGDLDLKRGFKTLLSSSQTSQDFRGHSSRRRQGKASGSASLRRV
jgi:hypothetical protein